MVMAGNSMFSIGYPVVATVVKTGLFLQSKKAVTDMIVANIIPEKTAKTHIDLSKMRTSFSKT